MSRFSSALRLNLLLQFRYGFYYAAAFVVVLWAAMLIPLPESALSFATPLVVFAELAVIGYYFVAGMVLFEKDERTLYALVSTPLRFSEYLGSKLATLTLMAVAASLIVVVAGHGSSFDVTLLILAVVLTSLISILAGFISVLPFDAISRYLVPSQLPLFVMALPLVPFLDIWQNPVFYLILTHGALILLSGAFGTTTPTTWQILYSILYGILSIGLLCLIARSTFDRYIVRGR
ncbi:multidrug ABC transporter permease [soil metagenome]